MGRGIACSEPLGALPTASKRRAGGIEPRQHCCSLRSLIRRLRHQDAGRSPEREGLLNGEISSHGGIDTKFPLQVRHMAATNSEKVAIAAALFIGVILYGLFSSGIIVHVSPTTGLEPPSPTPPKAAQKQQGIADEKAHPTRGGDGDADAAISSRNKIASKPRRGDHHDKSGGHQSEATADWWAISQAALMLSFTGVLALVAVLQIIHLRSKSQRVA